MERIGLAVMELKLLQTQTDGRIYRRTERNCFNSPDYFSSESGDENHLLLMCKYVGSTAYPWKSTRFLAQSHAIQIKFCAEYRDMLPRPRLVCQEPGLRPIGRSPCVPDKSSRGLGRMSRYSAQILLCFIAYIFHFFYSSVSLVGNFTGLPVCTVPSAIVHCNQNETGHQTIKAPSMPCWGATGQGKLSGIYATGPVKFTGKMDETCINGKFSVQEPSEWRVFLHTCE